MIERLFIGWKQPPLPASVQILQQRYCHDGIWDMTAVLLVVPGGKAGRRLRQIIEETATSASVTLISLSDPVTLADLLERLHHPGLPIASPMQVSFAWMQAARRSRPPQEGPVPDEPSLASEGQRLREAAAAECLSIAALSAAGDDPHWKVLARLEEAYRSVLVESGLSDRDDARMDALAADGVSYDGTIFLVGVQDLNGLERAMLSALTSPVCAIIPAPEGERNGFDETGCLRVEYWQQHPLPVPETCLQFVEGPADEANALVTRITTSLNGEYAAKEITVGIGDASGAEALARRLAISGLPTASPFGRPLARFPPGALLSLMQSYLHNNSSARSFAALIRHPDLEQWLTESTLALLGDNADWPETARAMADGSLLHCLDHYRTESLIEHFPPTETDAPTNALEVARRRVLAARDRLETLLAPLWGSARPLSQWAGPIARVLRTVFGVEPPSDDTAGGRQFRRSLTGFSTILQEMAQLPTTLAPTMMGKEALAFVCAEAEAVRLPTDPDGPAVAMLGWLELALDDAPVLLLTGLHEGNIPASSGDDALLPDSLRRQWGLADDRRRQARDAWLLRLMLESRRNLQIIVNRRSADGSPKMPSRLLFACDGLTAAKRAARFTDTDAASKPTRLLFAPGAARRLPPPLPLPPPTEINTLKVTAFRDYLACPYRFYLRHVVGLDEIGDDEGEMDPRAFGNLLHPCLESFARSPVADSTDAARITAYLREALVRQCHRRFGTQMPSAVRFQVRQAGKRLEAFAYWQAQSARDGWQIQNDLAEREIEAALDVDGRPFIIRGRLDRVDYHPATDRFRIIDYKTGDAGASPEDKHRSAAEGGGRAWTDLQLPLYRILLAAQGFSENAIEVGYVLLASDLNLVSVSQNGRSSGGTGFVAVRWDENDYQSARECAANVVRRLREGVFWPPAEPPHFSDAFSGLCLDACSDRSDWFGVKKDDHS